MNCANVLELLRRTAAIIQPEESIQWDPEEAIVVIYSFGFMCNAFVLVTVYMIEMNSMLSNFKVNLMFIRFKHQTYVYCRSVNFSHEIIFTTELNGIIKHKIFFYSK